MTQLDIINDLLYPFGYISPSFRLLVEYQDYAHVGLASSSTKNQAEGSQFAQVPVNNEARYRTGRLAESYTDVPSPRCLGSDLDCT